MKFSLCSILFKFLLKNKKEQILFENLFTHPVSIASFNRILTSANFLPRLAYIENSNNLLPTCLVISSLKPRMHDFTNETPE